MSGPAPSSAVQGTPRRALNPEDVQQFRLITDAQISPDGRLIAYVVKSVDWENDAYVSEIWLAPSDRSQDHTQLTKGSRASHPKWAPDGSSLAFAWDVDPSIGQSIPRSVFTIDVSGAGAGSARRLTYLENDVSNERTYPVISETMAWSPDGKGIVVAALDPPDPNADPHVYRYETLRYKSGDYGWWDGRRRHLWFYWLDGRPPTRLTSGDWDAFGPAFSPDGLWVAFSSARAFQTETVNGLPDSNPYQPKDIWIVRSNGSGENRRITDADGPNMSPSFSPDGTKIAYFGHRVTNGAWGFNTHLWVRDVGGGEPIDVLSDWDHTAGSHVMSDVHDVRAPTAWWSTDGKSLLFVGTARGRSDIFIVPSGGGVVGHVTEGEHEVELASFDAERGRYAALIGDETRPSDLYIGAVSSSGGTRLTALNDALLDEVYTCPAESFTYESRGLSIDGFLLRPADFDNTQKYPLVLEIYPSFVHGPGFNYEYQMLAGQGFLVFYANPRGSSSYGEAFLKDSFVRGHLFADFDDQMTGIQEVAARGYVDTTRLGVTGDAYGGTMTNWIIGTTRAFAASIARRGATSMFKVSGDRTRAVPANLYRSRKNIESSAVYLADAVQTPHLIIHSVDDRRGAVSEAEELFVLLRGQGKTARLVLFRNDTHFLSRMGSPQERSIFFSEILAWFRRYLRPASQGTNGEVQ